MSGGSRLLRLHPIDRSFLLLRETLIVECRWRELLRRRALECNKLHSPLGLLGLQCTVMSATTHCVLREKERQMRGDLHRHSNSDNNSQRDFPD